MAATPQTYHRRSSVHSGPPPVPPFTQSSRATTSARTPTRLPPPPADRLGSGINFSCPSPSPVRVGTPPRTRPPISASPVRVAMAFDENESEAPRLLSIARPTGILAPECKPAHAASARPGRPFTFLTPPSAVPEPSPVKSFDKERSDEWSVSSAALSSSYASSFGGGWAARRPPIDSSRSCDASHGAIAAPRSVTPTTRRPSDAYTPQVPKSRPPSQLGAARASLRALAEEWSDKSSHSPHYGEGGYLGVSSGFLLGHRYTLLEKLGWGEFSTVWLARDAHATSADAMYVAIKVARCSSAVSASTRYEVGLLKHLRSTFAGTKSTPRRRVAMTPLIDALEHRGPHGVHACVVLPTFGPNLLCVIDTFKRRRRRLGSLDIHMLKYVVRNIAMALDDLSSVDVLHTDLKPENVLLAFPQPRLVKALQRAGRLTAEEAERLAACGDQRHAVVLADFGLSVLMDPDSPVGPKASFKILQRGRVHNASGTLIQTREYRAPEVIVGADFESRTDVWSLGCIIFELLTGDFLFDPKRKTRVERDMDVEHLALMMQIHGPMAASTISRGSTSTPRYSSRYFSPDGAFLYADHYAAYPRRNIEAELAPYVGSQEASAAAELILACVRHHPSTRPLASEVLRARWLQDVGDDV